MSGNIIRNESDIVYTITHPDWICEWIVPFDKTRPIKRSCLLNHDVDPLDHSRSEYIIKLIPGLFTEVQRVIKEWNTQGDANARLLLLNENKPAFILHAENILGLKIIT